MPRKAFETNPAGGYRAVAGSAARGFSLTSGPSDGVSREARRGWCQGWKRMVVEDAVVGEGRCCQHGTMPIAIEKGGPAGGWYRQMAE